jgi:bifunctional UDP-N-acetylglucosamine pyrophosphorylase/glucosamine-1-phosphate N-acetyltransferase
MGVNDRAQLAEAERLVQAQQTAALMAQGVSFADPARVDIRGTLNCGIDCFIDVNTVFIGDVILGEGVSVGPGVVVEDSVIGHSVQIKPHTVIEGAVIAEACQLGPFARIRPGSNFASGVKIGNFVETKKGLTGSGRQSQPPQLLGRRYHWLLRRTLALARSPAITMVLISTKQPSVRVRLSEPTVPWSPL